MNKVKNGKEYAVKDDHRKILKVCYEDGDKIGLLRSIVPGCDPNNAMEIIWTTEKEILEQGSYEILDNNQRP